MGDPQVASQRAHWSKPTTSKNRSKYQQTMNLGDLYAQVPATEESRRSGTSYGWAECPCRPVCIHLHSLQPWSERGEEQDGAFCTIHVCVSAGAGKALLSVDLCGQPCVCVVCFGVPCKHVLNLATAWTSGHGAAVPSHLLSHWTQLSLTDIS